MMPSSLWKHRLLLLKLGCVYEWQVSELPREVCKKILFCERSTRKHFVHKQVPFLPTSYKQSWGLSTPENCTFWAFEPGPSAPTLWWSSFSPYQTKARTISEAWACLVDWTEAWTASEMKRDEGGEKKNTEELWNTMKDEWEEWAVKYIHRNNSEEHI